MRINVKKILLVTTQNIESFKEEVEFKVYRKLYEKYLLKQFLTTKIYVLEM